MADVELESTVRQLRPTPTTVLGAITVLAVETFLIMDYVARPTVTVTNPLILLYPFVWINISSLAVLTTRPPQAPTRRRYVVLAIAAVYFFILAYFGGLVGIGENLVPLQIDWNLPPGYSPAILYNGPFIQLILEPYKVVGYLTLTYLVYVTVLDAAGAAVSGIFGLFSCVSCTFPVIATVATTLFGSTSIIATVAFDQPYLLGTIVFVSSVALLWWRPTL